MCVIFVRDFVGPEYKIYANTINLIVKLLIPLHVPSSMTVCLTLSMTSARTSLSQTGLLHIISTYIIIRAPLIPPRRDFLHLPRRYSGNTVPSFSSAHTHQDINILKVLQDAPDNCGTISENSSTT